MSELVGAKIKHLRELKGISQKQMAEHLHLKESSYAKLEKGEGRLHTERLEKIAQLLDVTTNDLLNSSMQFICTINDNGKTISQVKEVHIETINNHDYSNQEIVAELIKTKNDLIEQQQQQIQLLNNMVEMLKQKT